MWSHGSRLLTILSSPSRSILCRCLLSVAVFWTGRKQDVVDHWPCAGSSVGVELRAFLMPNDGRLATQQTPTLHLIITDILHVTKFLTYSPIDKYLPIDGEKSSPVGPHAPGQGCARVRPVRYPSLLHTVSSTHILTDRRARATSFQFIRHDTVTFPSPTTAGVQLINDRIAVST